MVASSESATSAVRCSIIVVPGTRARGGGQLISSAPAEDRPDANDCHGMSSCMCHCHPHPTVANAGTMAITGSANVPVSLTSNTGTIDFTGSTDTVTMVGRAARGTVTNDDGITWVDDGADCTTTTAA